MEQIKDGKDLTMAEKLREIIEEELKYTCPHEPPREAKNCELCILRIDHITSKIKSLLKSKLLEKNEEMKTKWVPCPSCGRYVTDIDYNYVLTEIEKIVEDL